MAEVRSPGTEETDQEKYYDEESVDQVDVDLLASELLDALDFELQRRAPLEDHWSEWLRLYRGTPRAEEKTSPLEKSSNLVINLSAIYVDSVAARIMGGIFGIEPHWSVIQKSRDVADYAKPLEHYLDGLRQHTWKHYRVVKNAVGDVLKFGTGIIHCGWSDRMTTIFDSGQQKTTVQSVRSGPLPSWVPREDFVIPDGFVSVNDDEDQVRAPWIAHRQWFSWPALQRQSFDADLDDIQDKPDPLPHITQLRAKSETGGM